MNKTGQKQKKENAMDIIECVKAGDGLTVGRRYLKLDIDETGDNILFPDDDGEKSIISADHFKVVDVATN